MTRRTARVWASGVLAACVLAVLISIPVGVAARNRITPGQIVIVGDANAPRTQQLLEELQAERAAGNPLQDTTQGYNPSDPWTAVILLVFVLWMGVGVLILWRQPTNWAGWLFLITGAPFPLLALTQALVVYDVKVDPGSVPLVSLWVILCEFGLYPIALLPLLFLLYPDGHAPSERWRWAARGLVGGTVLAAAGFLVRPGPYNSVVGDGILYVNPVGVDALADVAPIVIGVGTIVALLSALSTVVAVRQRFKRSIGEERQRMRWLAFVAAIAGVFFVSMWVVAFVAELLGYGAESGEDAPVFEVLFALTGFTLVIGIPAAYLIAIFRYRLYDLDVVIKKTVQYAVLVAVFILVGLVVVIAIPALIFGVDAGPGLLPVLGLSLVLALAFTWIRPRAARMADRVVYGRRATPYEVLSEFSDRVGETYSTDDVLPKMAQLVAAATGARRVDVWLASGRTLRAEGSYPEGTPAATRRVDGELIEPMRGEHVAEVRHQGALLGAITLEPAPDDPLDPSKESLVRDLAAQAGLVLHNVHLIEELRASRRRLVAAQDEERRKLERNIHDGVQQQIVALTVQLRLVEQMIERDAAKARDIVAGLQARSTEVLEDLRDLARGIYPPLLADKGLAAALEAQAQKSPISVTVTADGIDRYPQAVESAVYFSCLEALNNVAKYAEATDVSISLSSRNDILEMRVRDDGRGFDASATSFGTGLQGIADRLDAIGGTMSIDSRPGAGTTVRAEIPLAKAEDARM